MKMLLVLYHWCCLVGLEKAQSIRCVLKWLYRLVLSYQSIAVEHLFWILLPTFWSIVGAHNLTWILLCLCKITKRCCFLGKVFNKFRIWLQRKLMSSSLLFGDMWSKASTIAGSRLYHQLHRSYPKWYVSVQSCIYSG